MSVPREKEEIITRHQLHETDKGSPEVQVALLTSRIVSLTEHVKQFPKDQASKRGLLNLVGQRRRMLNYVSRQNINRYRSLIEALGIRR